MAKKIIIRIPVGVPNREIPEISKCLNDWLHTNRVTDNPEEVSNALMLPAGWSYEIVEVDEVELVQWTNTPPMVPDWCWRCGYMEK